METINMTRCACGAEFVSSNGRAVCTDCHLTRHNRVPGTRQADAVDRPGVVNRLRPLEGGRDVYLRTYGVRLAEGFAMFGGVC